MIKTTEEKKERVVHGSVMVEKVEFFFDGFDIDLTRKQVKDLVSMMQKAAQDGEDGECVLTIVRDGDKMSLHVSTKKRDNKGGDKDDKA